MHLRARPKISKIFRVPGLGFGVKSEVLVFLRFRVWGLGFPEI